MHRLHRCRSASRGSPGGGSRNLSLRPEAHGEQNALEPRVREVEAPERYAGSRRGHRLDQPVAEQADTQQSPERAESGADSS
jgi:hypothetical protein